MNYLGLILFVDQLALMMYTRVVVTSKTCSALRLVLVLNYFLADKPSISLDLRVF